MPSKVMAKLRSQFPVPDRLHGQKVDVLGEGLRGLVQINYTRRPGRTVVPGGLNIGDIHPTTEWVPKAWME